MNNSTMLKTWTDGDVDQGLTRKTFEHWTEHEQRSGVLCACLAACEQVSDYGVNHKERAEKGTLATFRIALTILTLGMGNTLVEASRSATK